MIDRSILDLLIEDDCTRFMAGMPSDSVDMVFVDPPFNLGKRYSSYKDVVEDPLYIAWCRTWLFQCMRVLKPSGSLFVHNTPKWLVQIAGVLEGMGYFRHWIGWEAPTRPMGKSLQPSHYGILFYTKEPTESKFYEIRYPHKRCRKCGYLHKDYGGKKGEMHPFGPLVGDVWTDIHRVKHNKYRDNHPCQLPLHLLERLVLMSTDEGDVVLDPMMGTGTTVLAAWRLGRRFIGVDIGEEYVGIAGAKLELEKRERELKGESKVGGRWVGFYPGSRSKLVSVRDGDWKEIEGEFEVPGERRDIDHTSVGLK